MAKNNTWLVEHSFYCDMAGVHDVTLTSCTPVCSHFSTIVFATCDSQHHVIDSALVVTNSVLNSVAISVLASVLV